MGFELTDELYDDSDPSGTYTFFMPTFQGTPEDNPVEGSDETVTIGLTYENPTFAEGTDERTCETLDQEVLPTGATIGFYLPEADSSEYETIARSVGDAVGLPAFTDSYVGDPFETGRVIGNFTYPVEGTTEDASLHTENAAITPAADTITGVKLTGYEITKLISVSRAASAMTVAAFESFLTEIIGESIARRIENYIFTGTGSNQPGGVKTAGKGTSGAYTDGTDQVTVAASGTLSEANVVDLYSMLGSGYERNAVWCMRKTSFFKNFYPLMNKSKNNLIEFANGRYYVMGNEVYFTASVPANEAYLGDFGYIIGNYSQDITVTSSDVSGLRYNSIDYLAACVFDSQPAAGLGAFVHLAKASA